MGRGALGVDVFPATRARRGLKQVFDRVIHGHLPVPMERGAEEWMVAIGRDELAEVLSRYEFHPEVIFDDDVAIWLPEFGIYGNGEDFEQAKADFIEEVCDYVADYFDEDDDTLRKAPNRRHHFPYALRVLVADSDNSLEEMLFAQPRELAGAGV